MIVYPKFSVLSRFFNNSRRSLRQSLVQELKSKKTYNFSFHSKTNSTTYKIRLFNYNIAFRTVFGGTVGPNTVTLSTGETQQVYIGIRSRNIQNRTNPPAGMMENNN